jgi:ribosome maturation factor RimP
VYIDKEGGIFINDCELVSRALSEILDKDDPIEDAYILEVSSPGLGRPIKKDKDFQRNLGDEVEVRTYKPINKQKEFVGLLEAWDKESVTLQMESGELFTIARTDIALIREYIEF